MYIVADRQRSDEQHYYSTGPNGVTRTGGPVHTAAGYGRITGYFWCVKGAPSSEVLFFESLYRVLRKVRADRNSPPETAPALEYLLWNLEDFGANPSLNLGYRFHSVSDAVEALNQKGIRIRVPEGLQ
jgi:hypothetical protein